MKKLSFTILLLSVFSCFATAQWKSYKISVKKDTINEVDMNGLKQGRWVVHVDPLRGERGYEEVGVFVNNKKEGHWRKYTLQGDIIAYENYLNGDKQGTMIILPVRDKTLKIWTEGNEFVGDLDKIILANLSFVP